MTTQVFIDECKRNTYTIAVATLTHARIEEARRSIRALLLPGARSIHFNAESEAKRREVLHVIGGLGVAVTIYQAQRRRELDARLCILERVIKDVALTSVTRMVLERDDSLVSHDTRALTMARTKAAIEREFTFDHLRAHEEPMLWIPDAVAWAYTKDSIWRSRVATVVTREITV